MEIDLINRHIRIGVGEFSEFKSGPSSSSLKGASRFRMEIGQQWHTRLQETAKANQSANAFEVSIKEQRVEADWIFQFQGRIDQLLELESEVKIKEVKSVSISLPTDPEDLIAAYKSYFLQLATYCCLWKSNSATTQEKSVCGELIFVEIESGITQTVGMDSQWAQALYTEQRDKLLSFLHRRQYARKNLFEAQISPPFEQLREGQDAAVQKLESGNKNKTTVLFEAPTGFGKTGIVLHHALKQLKHGFCDRIIYLTGKSTGQLQVLKQTENMIPPQSGLFAFQLRSSAEHGPRSSEYQEKDRDWDHLQMDPQELFRQKETDLESIKELSARLKIDAFDLTKALLPYADVWVCDYNYIFHPSISRMFESVSGYNPRQTLLIVDEAHNLPSRTAGNFVHTLAFKEVEDVCIELQLNAVNKPLRDACNALAAWLRRIEKSEEVASSFLYELSDILSHIETEFSKTHLEETLFSNSARECIWEYLEALRTLQTADIELLLWAPENKTLRISCLDAATVIKQQINPFAQKILMSATLTPPKAFMNACALAGEEIAFIRGSSPWRDNAYSVAIDMRVDTRMKERNRYFRPTAQTAIEMRLHSLNPVVVFFPSYAYAKSIQLELEMIAPEMRVALQPKGGNLAEQEHFVSDALKFSDFLFLVLGSSFSEGIDLLGGYVDSCMVVGPALPEVNAVQQGKMRRAVESRDKAFQRIYSIPALTKINQALGRLVRHPNHKAKVLLHCKRFARDDYYNLLDPVYQNGIRITSGNELRIWLGK